jgi:hypothetical protein
MQTQKVEKYTTEYPALAKKNDRVSFMISCVAYTGKRVYDFCPKMDLYIGEELDHANEVLVNCSRMKMIFDYPLNTNVYKIFKSKKGFFTFAEVIKKIRETYMEIYTKQEDNTWGHGIYDLFIESIKLADKDEDGNVRVDLFIGS